jgi:MFS family permease
LLATTLMLWVASFLLLLTVYIIINWLPGIVRAEGYSLQTSILAISLCNVGTIVGAIAIGFLMDRVDPFKVLPAALVCAAVSLVSLDLTRHELPIFLVAAFASGLFGGGASAAFGALIISLYPVAMRATGSGWALGIGRLGAALGPVVIGAALTAGLVPARLFEVAAASALSVALCLIALASLLRTPMRRPS